MTTNRYVYENEFIFNETEYFTNLINSHEQLTENQKAIMLHEMRLEDDVYRYEYKKDRHGLWFKLCYKNGKPILWTDTPNWMRPYAWKFEKEHNVFQ